MADYAVVTGSTVGQLLSVDQAFTLAGIQHPDNWLRLSSTAERTALSIFPISHTSSPDPRYNTISGETFTWNGGNSTVDGAWSFAPRTLAVCKTSKLTDLSAYALGKDGNGTTFGGFPIFTTDHYKILYLVYNQRAIAGTQASFNLPDSTGVFHTLTAVQMQNLYTAAAAYVGAVLNNQNTHATAINALSDNASVIAYDFTTGWPT